MTNCLILAQGGGPTAVINQTLVGAILETRRRDPSLRILGARHGVSGLINEDWIDLSNESEDHLKHIAALPSAALGSTRDKPDDAYCDRILERLSAQNARAFIYIGGNDTSGTLDSLQTRGGNSGIQFVHAPKTIDNDLAENDHTPGFISAGWFVATAFASIDLDFRALPGIYVGIVMGRHAGFLTAASAAWRREEGDGPHYVYGPENPFSVDQMIADAEAACRKHGRCLVALSEGVEDTDGRPLAESLSQSGPLRRDAHGNVELSNSDLGFGLKTALANALPDHRARVDTFGYLPRGFIGTIAEQDAAEARTAGEFAAASALEQSGSVVLKYRDGNTCFELVPLDAVANKTRLMPAEFYNGRNNHLSAAGMEYIRRLIPGPEIPARPYV